MSCCCSVPKSCPTLCEPMDFSTPRLPVLHYFLRFAQTHVHWFNDAIQASHPLSPPFPRGINLSQYQGLFQWVSCLHQVAKYWSFSFSISSSNEYSEFISFRVDWFDLFAVQGTLKSHLQFHRSKASIFSVQPSLWSNSHISMWLLEGGSDSKESACNAGDPGLIPGLGRSPGEGNSYSLQNSCLENPMDRGSLVGYSLWVTKSWTQLSD